MAKPITLVNVRPQVRDILRVRCNQQPFPQNELKVQVKKVVVTPQQFYAVCEVDGQEKEVSLGQGTEVVENLW